MNRCSHRKCLKYGQVSLTLAGCIADGFRFGQTDVRGILTTIQVPTLIFYRAEFPNVVSNAKYLASRIRQARLVELRGFEVFPWAVQGDTIVREVERFLGTVRAEEADLDRVLATVLFTDIVGSTEKVVPGTWRVFAAH